MIWIVGNNGMLGKELTEALDRAGLPAVGSDREVDIADPAALAAFTAGKDISWIVNCAAYTAVDKAEDEGELAARLNAQGPENLARLAADSGAAILHISTDYVFSGDAAAPYGEDDPVAPTGVYGATKAAGEEKVRQACVRSVILRTAWLYGRHGPNFVATMLRLMAEREKISVVADQRGSPTWAGDLAAAIVAVLGASQPRYGTYHYSGGGECSWFDFALEIQRQGRRLGLLDRDCVIEPLTTAQYPTKARRPAYSVLCKDKIVADYGVAVPDWRESLERYLQSLTVKV